MRIAAPLFLCTLALGQTPPAGDKFEVASVKPAARGPSSWRGGPGTPDPGEFTATSMTLFALALNAWQLRPYRITGLPEESSDVYTVMAKVPPGSTREQFDRMIRNLLIDRFALTLHNDTREMAVYELVVASGGSKLKEHVDADSVAAGDAAPQLSTAKLAQVYHGHLRVQGSGKPMVVLAKMMELQSGRPVIDKTGLSGSYDYSVEFAPNPLAPPRPGIDPNDPSPDFFRAIESQLGLKLVPKKDAVPVLHVDHFNRLPTAN